MLRLFALCLITLVTLTQAADDTKEPPENFSLEVNGVRKPIKLNKPFNPGLVAGATQAVLRVEPHRAFDGGGVKFNYPREFTFQFTANENHKLWEMEGPECRINVHLFPVAPNKEVIRKVMIDSVLESLKANKSALAPTTLKLNGVEYKGDCINARILGFSAPQELYFFQSGGSTILLLLAISPEKMTPEAEAALKMLKETFVLSEK